MKRILTLIFCIGGIVGCKSQVNEDVLKYFKNRKVVNAENFVFATDELVALCHDSLGRSNFKRSISLIAPRETKSAASREKLILLTVIKEKVRQVNTNDTEAKEYALTILDQYAKKVTVDLDLILARFKWDESRAETCDIEHSMFVFFVYNPVLYIRAANQDPDLKKQEAPFPFSCTLENENIPLSLRIKMKNGLLELIRNETDPKLKNISNEIKVLKFE